MDEIEKHITEKVTLEELKRSGIELVTNNKRVSFEEIIEGYANHSVADFR